MKLSDVKKLADAFEKSTWEEVHLVSDGVEVHISTHAGTPAHSSVVSASESVVEVGGDAPLPATASASPAPAAQLKGDPLPEGTIVPAPSLGIFWRSPSPGAPPFVEVGQRVDTDTPICIVEVMKLMNRVPAGVAGTVVAVLAENGGAVEKGQPLIIVDESK